MINLLIRAFPSANLIDEVREELHKIAQSIEKMLLSNGWSIATAESCTGGGIAAALTAIPGSSACVKGGIVAYSEEIKKRLLGVSAETLQTFGVVSRQTVEEMARGAMKSMISDFSVATSGVAGPSGGTEETPVGTIWVAVSSPSQMVTHCIRSYNEGREENVQNAVLVALEMVRKVVENEENQAKK